MNKPVIFDTTPNYEAIKGKQKAAWASGDYALIGITLQIVGENLADSLDIYADQDVLDVAAGNGNFSLAAARRWANVTSTDYVETLLERGRQRANVDGFDLDFKVADAEELPFTDASFDVVASTFGVMFTPDQKKSASEMLRVCKSGGKIGMANWTPDSFVGSIFKVIGRYLPPPAGLKSPALWGTTNYLEELFGEDAREIDIVRKNFNFRYRSPEHWLDIFRTYYGPVHKAFAVIDEIQQAALTQDLIDLVAQFNVAQNGSMAVPGEYLEVVVTRQ